MSTELERIDVDYKMWLSTKRKQQCLIALVTIFGLSLAVENASWAIFPLTMSYLDNINKSLVMKNKLEKESRLDEIAKLKKQLAELKPDETKAHIALVEAQADYRYISTLEDLAADSKGQYDPQWVGCYSRIKSDFASRPIPLQREAKLYR